ncbi:hypothetical protein LPB138_05965 [Urechidicola croceus]|uniref:LPS-assembly protein LptD central domain-containing protein n=1 Tax=Urechidicola croceus TaxID=1850246 RepID=A0A1D8PBQ9_9FLAO|nr:hypothetical protein LPB138_05965 [Urechidicola croceus]
MPATDSINSAQDSVTTNITELLKPKDSTQIDSIKKPKGAIEDIITHTATDYIKQNFIKNLITLHNNAEIDYQDINIKAGHIVINNENDIITATGIKDSLGYTQKPIVVQGGQESVHDSIKINRKTERALAWGTRSKLGELDSRTGVTKKVNDSTIYIRDVIITTSDKEIPDYHIAIDNGKMVPEKKIVAGKSQLYIAEVPTPVILPFAYFPLTKGRTSGILMPSYGSNNDQGFFLQNGGYYIAASDYFDVAILGDIYTNGSWGLNVQSNYKLLYKFNGTFSVRYENLIDEIRGFDGYGERTNYNIRWSHSQDSKANPNARFSASVNLGSSKYYRQSLNEFNTNSILNNTLSSSISFQKRFVGTPFNMSSTITHSQNTNTESIIMSLPSVQVSMDRIYPFAPKNGPKKNMLQNLGVTYNFKGDYRINTTDEFFFKSEMFKDAKSGMQHDANLSTSMKVMKHFTLSPSAKYKEVWYFDKLNKFYDESNNEVVTDTIKGFNSFREYNIGLSLSTTLYGDVSFKKGRLQAIRHTMRPSISYSYRPDFSFYYDEVQQSADPLDVQEYSQFDSGIYGRPGRGLSNSIGISIANTLEAKVMSKDSTETEPKKVSILKNLNLSTGYNIAADSLKWSPVSVNAGTSFFNNQLSLNVRGTLDPYALDVNGNKIDKFNINNGGSLFRLTNAGVTMGYSLSSKSLKKDGDKNSSNDRDNSDILNESLGISNEEELPGGGKEVKSTKLYNSTMPWTLRLSYAFNYSNARRQDEISSHSIMFSGDLELTPKWKVGFNSSYDIKNQGFGLTRLNFNRDLDSWKMSFNWVPFGDQTRYNFFIGVKSGVLSDLKYDKRKLPDRRLF